MKPWAVTYYRCPLTGAPLRLDAWEADTVDLEPGSHRQLNERGLPVDLFTTQVRSGILINDREGIYYPIENYVPVLLDFDNPFYAAFEARHRSRRSAWSRYRRPAGRPRAGEIVTQRTFTDEWNEVTDDAELTFTYDHEERRSFMRMELGGAEAATRAADDLVLDVGCGSGLEADLLAQVTQAMTFGIDLNFSMLRTSERWRRNALVHNAVASLFAPPFEASRFDLVYSHGVLHHTYDTHADFVAIERHRNATGELVLWVYALEDARRGNAARRLTYATEQLLRPRLATLPPWPQAVVVHALAWHHFRRYQRKGIKRRQWRYANSLHSMRDRWTCRYAHRHSFHEVIGWFAEAGMRYHLLDPKAYRERLGRNLIGIAVRGEPSTT